MAISTPLALPGCLPVGPGVNMHTNAVTAPGTVLAKYGWMRFDDVAVGASLSAMQTNHSYAKTPHFNVVQIISAASYDANIGGHARDVVISCPNMDWLEVDNEPEIHNITPTQYVNWLIAIRRACRGLNVRIMGPSLSTWEGGSGGTAQTWFASFIALGGLTYLDAVSMHFYLSTDHGPEVIATHAAEVRALIGNLPLVCTEWGVTDKYCETYLGLGRLGWTAAAAAGLYARAQTTAASINLPIAFYDGPLTKNSDDYGVSTTASNTVASATQDVASTANMIQGQTLYFATADALRIIQSITDGNTVVLTQSVSATADEVVIGGNTHESLTDNTALTTMGAALNAVMPVGGVGAA